MESGNWRLVGVTNADKIRKMTNEELAQVIDCPYSIMEELCNRDIGCIECCKNWLENIDDDEILELLNKSLKKFHISDNSYSVGKYAEEAICIERDSIGWMVYGGERGNKHDMKLHSDCKNACLDVISRVTETDDDEKRLTDFFNEEYEKL